MKRYRIIKIIYAKNFTEAVKKEITAEIAEISLDEHVKGPADENIGFKR